VGPVDPTPAPPPLPPAPPASPVPPAPTGGGGGSGGGLGPGIGEAFTFGGSDFLPPVPITLTSASPQTDFNSGPGTLIVGRPPFAIGPEVRDRIVAQTEFSIDLSRLFVRGDGQGLALRNPDALRHEPVPGLDIGEARRGDADGSDALSDVDVTLIGSIVFSLGLVIWASRGGALLTSLLAATPAWQNFDPLPVLRERDERHDISDPDAEAEPETLQHSQQGDSTQAAAAGSTAPTIEGPAPTRRIGADGQEEVRP